MRLYLVAAAVFCASYLAGGVLANCTKWCQVADYTVAIGPEQQICVINDVGGAGFKAGLFYYDKDLNNVKSNETQEVTCQIYPKFGCQTPCALPNWQDSAKASGPPGNVDQEDLIATITPVLARSCVPQS